jgi:electron transfer flavoprotein beta subunit
MGKQSIDGDNNQTGQMFAALANLPQGTFASELAVNSNHVTVTREVDGGFQTLQLTLPAVITSDLRLNEPRYASLPSIMQAKKKPIHETTPEELDVDIAPRVSVVSVDFPPERPEGVKVSSVDELLEKLKNEAKVI